MDTLDSLLRKTDDAITIPHDLVDRIMMNVTSHVVSAKKWALCRSVVLLSLACFLLIYALSELVFDIMLGEGFDFMRVAFEEPSTLLSPETHFALWEVLPFPSMILSIVAFGIVVVLLRNFFHQVASFLMQYAI